jgi:hypothetical protein
MKSATNQPRWILTRLLDIGEGIDPFTGEDLKSQTPKENHK